MAVGQIHRTANAGERRSPGSKSGVVRAYLYDAKGSDREVEISGSTVKRLRDTELLWVDVVGDDDRPLRAVAEEFEIDQEALSDVLRPAARPRLEASEEYFHISAVMARESGDRFEPFELHAFVGSNWIVTAHRSDLDLVADFNRPITGETGIGKLDGPVFLATLLDWALTGYYRVLERLEDKVDQLDERLLSDEVDQERLLRNLVRIRRQITEVRQLLTPHRDVLAILTQPDSEVFTSSDSSAQFQRVYERLEKAIEAVDTTREMLIGSFEVFMTQTAQRTNDVMKILTLFSVLLLPCVVIAGILGMNFRLGIFRESYLFWVSIGLMAALASGTLILARRRRWI